MCAGTKTGTGNPPGFPSLRTLGHTARIANAGVTVFSQPSKKESLIVQLKDAASLAGARSPGFRVSGLLGGF